MMGRNKPMRRGQGAAQITPQQAKMLFAKMSPEQKRKFAQMRNAMASRMGRR
jgi:hypothetical protein